MRFCGIFRRGSEEWSDFESFEGGKGVRRFGYEHACFGFCDVD